MTVWTRERAGLYRCGNWTIEKIELRYRPQWCVQFAAQTMIAVQLYYPTLHQARVAADGIIRRELLVSFAQIE